MPAKVIDPDAVVVNEVDVDVDLIDFDVVDDVQAEFEDTRDYVDKCFQNFSPEQGVLNKSVRRIYCVENEEPTVGPGEIAALFNYKCKPAKGRKSPLAGYDVLHISLPTGPLRIPLVEAEDFGRYLIGVARSITKRVEAEVLSQTNDNIEQ